MVRQPHAQRQPTPRPTLVTPDFSRLIPQTGETILQAQGADIVRALSNREIFDHYFIGRFDGTKHASTQIPTCPNCLSSPIQYIGTQCQRGDGRYGSFHTVFNFACHHGLVIIDEWSSARSLREVGRRLTAQLPTLKKYEEEILKQVRDYLTFTLPSGKAAKTVNLSHEVDDQLASMAGSFGISKGVLSAVAALVTLSRQPKGYVSTENQAEILRTLAAFRGWLKLKAAMIDRGLEEIGIEEDETEMEEETEA